MFTVFSFQHMKLFLLSINKLHLLRLPCSFRRGGCRPNRAAPPRRTTQTAPFSKFFTSLNIVFHANDRSEINFHKNIHIWHRSRLKFEKKLPKGRNTNESASHLSGFGFDSCFVGGLISISSSSPSVPIRYRLLCVEGFKSKMAALLVAVSC